MSYDTLIFPISERTDGTQLIRHNRKLLPSPGKSCDGIVKLAQRWLLEFLTEKGSIKFQPERGSNFVTRLRNGNIATESDVFLAFASAAADVGGNLRNAEEAEDPDTERLGYARLTKVSLSSYGLGLSILVVSAAGQSQAIDLPFSSF